MRCLCGSKRPMKIPRLTLTTSTSSAKAAPAGLRLIHVDKSYVLNGLGNGFFKTRHILEVDEPMPAFRDPLVPTDSWIQGSADRGFALETIKEVLDLNLIYLSEIVREESEIGEKR